MVGAVNLTVEVRMGRSRRGVAGAPLQLRRVRVEVLDGSEWLDGLTSSYVMGWIATLRG